MSILDNEGHDQMGLGNTPSRGEVDKLRAEIERLRDDLASSERLREHAVKELGKDSDLVARLRAALVQVRGFVAVMGEHNWRDMRLHIGRQCDCVEQVNN